MDSICNNCRFFEPDRGTWCVNGWSRDGQDGQCLVEPVPVRREALARACRHFAAKP